MSTNKQRREAERLRLQRQLEQRREREVARRRFTTIASIVGSLVLIAAVVVVVVVASSGGDDKKTAAKGTSTAASASSTAAATAASSAAPESSAPLPTAACASPSQGSTATFEGLTITGATNLKAAPTVTGMETGTAPTTLQCQDLVVGTGQAAKTTDTGTVEYVGLVYKTGKVFQSSWDSSPATFGFAVGTPTQRGVIAGFSQGIAGAGKVAPMKVGGRRVLIMPAAIAYGASPQAGSGIPVNADLVFVVDLQKIGS